MTSMTVAFVRTAGAPDRFYVRRSDGTETSWSFPTYGAALPHDMVHFVVEAAFEVEAGFWGRVDSGVDVAKVNVEANRIGGADKYGGFGPDLKELYLAEALAVVPWGTAGESDEDCLVAVRKAFADADLRPQCELSTGVVAEVRATLDRLRETWQTVLPKGAIDLRWPLGDRESASPLIERITA